MTIESPLRRVDTRSEAPAAVALRWAKRRGLLLVILVFVALVTWHLDFIPFWDARNYLHCVEEAIEKPFDLLNFRCFDHPSIAYAMLWALSQYLWPWTPAFLVAVNAILGAASIAAFDATVRLLFPGRRRTEYTLVAALYALAPLFVAHAIFLNVDYGVTVFFVLFLYFLLAHRFWLANAAAIAMIFSKETGISAYAIVMVAYAVAFIPGVRGSRAQRMATLRSHMPLVGVPIVLLLYLTWIAVFRPDPAGWVHSYAPTQVINDRVQAILNTNLADPFIRSFLADLFVLNYQWLYTAIIIAALCRALLRVDRPDAQPMGLPRRGVFLGVTLVGLVYVVTRYGFTNAARYVLIASPVVILAFYDALLALVAANAGRVSYLAICAALVFLSNFRTLDIVSRSIFGIIPFGSHALLDMPSLTGGLRLDAMVYNLEFLQLQYLFADMIRDLRPPAGTTLLMGNAVYNFPPDVNGRTYALTSNPARAVPFFVAVGDVRRNVLESHMRRDGELFFYMAFANADNAQLPGLLNEYVLVARKQYGRYGYALDLYTFRFTFKRERVPLPQ